MILLNWKRCLYHSPTVLPRILSRIYHAVKIPIENPFPPLEICICIGTISKIWEKLMHFTRCNITNEALSRIASISSLQDLRIPYVRKITDDGVRSFDTVNPGLNQNAVDQHF